MMQKWMFGMVLGFAVCCPSLLRADEPTDDQKSAALELLQTMHMDQVLSGAITQMLDLQLKQNPKIEQFRPIMLDYLNKYMSWDAVKDDMANVYASEFSTEELKEMTRFFKTPTGQKFASKQTVLMSKGAEVGQRKVQAHMAELQQSIAAAAKNDSK